VGGAPPTSRRETNCSGTVQPNDDDPFRPPAAASPESARAPSLTWRVLLKRFLALAIDGVTTLVVVFVAGAIRTADWWNDRISADSYVAWAAMVAFLSTQLFWLMRYGATVGKRIAGVRIVRRDGSPAALWRIVFLRYVPVAVVLVGALESEIPLLPGTVLLLDAAFVLVPGRRCLHDWLAGTDVIASRWSYSNRSAHGALSGGEPPR
jgi:uncharacterized RDD family membrane protein YckC